MRDDAEHLVASTDGIVGHAIESRVLESERGLVGKILAHLQIFRHLASAWIRGYQDHDPGESPAIPERKYHVGDRRELA